MQDLVMKWAEQGGPFAMSLIVFCVLLWLAWKKILVPSATALGEWFEKHQKACSETTERMSHEAWSEVRAERLHRIEAERQFHALAIQMVESNDRNTSALHLLRSSMETKHHA